MVQTMERLARRRVRHFRLATLTLVTVVLTAGFTSLTAAAQPHGLPPRDGYVTDVGEVLSPEFESLWEKRLAEAHASSKVEVVIVTVNSVAPLSIFDYAAALEDSWSIGNVAGEAGVIVLITLGERRTLIQVTNNLAEYFPSADRAALVLDVLVPNQRAGATETGAGLLLEALLLAVGGFEPPPSLASPVSSPPNPLRVEESPLVTIARLLQPFFVLAVVVLVALNVAPVIRRGKVMYLAVERPASKPHVRLLSQVGGREPASLTGTRLAGEWPEHATASAPVSVPTFPATAGTDSPTSGFDNQRVEILHELEQLLSSTGICAAVASSTSANLGPVLRRCARRYGDASVVVVCSLEHRRFQIAVTEQLPKANAELEAALSRGFITDGLPGALGELKRWLTRLASGH